MTKTTGRVILWGLALLALVILFYPKQRVISIDLPPPESLAEPMGTYYLGAAALDLPSSFRLDYIKAIFYQVDPSDSTATITVSEKPGDGSFLMSKDFSTRLSASGRQLEAVDLSSKFSRPAMVKAYYNGSPRSWDVPNNAPVASEEIADPVELEIILKIQEHWGLLEFTYLRVLERAEAELTGGWWRIGQTALVEWAQKISDNYQWRGVNKPPTETGLAMKFGQIFAPADSSDWKVNFKAVFNAPESEHRLILNGPFLEVVIEGFNERPEMTEAANRIVGGHPGIEKREWRAQVKNTFEWLLHLPEMSALDLVWSDGSGREPSSRDPNWQINLVNLSNHRHSQNIARYLGGWEIVLNSIRLSSSASNMHETGGQPSFPEIEAGDHPGYEMENRAQP